MGKRRFIGTKLLLLTMLILTHLVVCSTAIPSTRIRRLVAVHKPQVRPALTSPRRQASGAAWVGMGSSWQEEDHGEEQVITGGGRRRRMGVALNDYPGSGANNRHIPKPPARK